MEKKPITLIIDDPTPCVQVYYYTNPEHKMDGDIAIQRLIPNSFFRDFCGVIEETGIKGKYSVVPMPGGEGNIIDGIPGVSREDLDEWIDLAKTRLSKYFDFCPEMLTHAQAVDLATGKLLDKNEKYWAAEQTEETLTPYITRAVEMLHQAGLTPSGVTSPWDFGIEVEEAYAAAVASAFDTVLNRKESWYFLHTDFTPKARPWVSYDKDGKRVVSVPRSVNDAFWATMRTEDTSEEYVKSVADYYITEDGKGGAIVDMLNAGGWPIICIHWQGLFSNGRGTGLRALRLVGLRVKEHLSDRVEWVNFTALMHRTLEGKLD